MYAEIISNGDEIINGKIPDTNTQWLSRALESLGISVQYLHWKCTVHFDEVLQNGNRIHQEDVADVLYIDRDYLYRVDEEAANHLAGTPVKPKAPGKGTHIHDDVLCGGYSPHILV